MFNIFGHFILKQLNYIEWTLFSCVRYDVAAISQAKDKNTDGKCTKRLFGNAHAWK